MTMTMTQAMTWTNAAGQSLGLIPGRSTLGPLFLLTASPVFVVGVLFRTLRHLGGSLPALLAEWRAEGVVGSVLAHWPSAQDPYVWKLIAYFVAAQLLIVRFVPGRTHRGPLTAAGNVPVYNANGFQAFTLSVGLFLSGVVLGVYPGGVLYDRLGEILSTMNVIGLVLCAVLYVKGRTFPSTTDSGSSGNPIFDYYWGTELYPRIAGFDVKQLTNCRCGMMFWALFVISAVLKQREVTGAVSDSLALNSALQLVYIAKFFYWESGYYNTMDIAHDRAGFYLCWGCLCFLPCVYVSHSLFLVAHPVHIGTPLAAGLFLLGLLSIYVNYDCDRQRMVFRAQNGNTVVWGSPARFVTAKYTTEKGDKRTSLLLASGYWGLSRHFNYVPELAAAFLWTSPVLWAPSSLLAFFYFPYLLLLLVDRAFRDDARCSSKYGPHWAEYCKAVPAKLIPGLF